MAEAQQGCRNPIIITLVCALVGGIFAILAACIGLGTPIIEWLIEENTKPTSTPTPTLVATEKIVIVDIFYDGTVSGQEPDEYVAICNDDSRPVQLRGWTLRDQDDHEFTFPDYVLQPGQTCRVYTNEHHPEWGGLSYECGNAIWTNSGDCAYLRDSTGTLIDEYCY